MLSNDFSSGIQAYRSTVNIDNVVSIAILFVNWSDSAQTVDPFNLVNEGIAITPVDSCTTTNLWDGTISYSDGGV